MLKVLIVDDSNSRIDLIIESLNSASLSKYLQIVRCNSADAARSELLEPSNLMILDVLLPKKDRGTPQASHSLNLLDDFNNPSKPFIRPGMVIGITADFKGLASHRNKFSESASIVLDGNFNETDWLTDLVRHVSTLIDSTQKTKRLLVDQVLISVHGIRTYGQWQAELANDIKKYSRSFEHIEVKYGYFDILCFYFPSTRARKVKQLGERVSNLIKSHDGKRICLVGHSFGTIILKDAFDRLHDGIKVDNVILCGSPLNENTCIDNIISKSSLTINECGLNDNVLLLSKYLVPQLGYAGRVGFYMENSSAFLNRYHVGGHSLYFEKTLSGHEFHEENWTSIILGNSIPMRIDNRKSSARDISEVISKVTSSIKDYRYLGAVTSIAILGYLAFKLTYG